MMTTQRAVTLAAATFIALIAAEGALRAIGVQYPKYYVHRPDPVFGWIVRPNVHGYWKEEGGAFFSTDADGFRDGGHAIAKSPGTYRVAVLGDSFVEALEVPTEDGVTSRLAHELAACGRLKHSPVETINFGVAGYGTAQELLVLERRVWNYHPDLVIVAVFLGNDLMENTAPDFRRRTGWARSIYSALMPRLRLLQLARRAVETRMAAGAPGNDGTDTRVFDDEPSAELRRAWDVTEALFVAMQKSASIHGTPLLFVTVGLPIQVYPDAATRNAFARALHVSDLLSPERQMAELAARRGLDLLTLAGPFQEYAETHGVFLHGFRHTGLGIGHWNSDGHALAARLIVRKICGATS